MPKPIVTEEPRTTRKLEVADLILALCESGEWELALRLAREHDGSVKRD